MTLRVANIGVDCMGMESGELLVGRTGSKC
jgi:hypothetical protein